MFSDKFTEINNYSLLRKEYLNTSSIMPWRYTSIFDNKYLPNLDNNTINRLSLFFYYKLQYTRQLLEDDKKYIEITHKDNQIKELKAINPIKFVAFSDISEWYHFIHTIECPELDPCRKKIMESANESLVTTGLSSVTYDELCNISGIYYNCPSFVTLDNSSEIIEKLYSVCGSLQSSILYVHISPDNNDLRLKIVPHYPVRTFGFVKVTDKSVFDSSNYFVTKTVYSEYTKNYISTLLDQELITQSMVDYISEIMPQNTKFEIEYLISSEGQIDDIIFKNILIEEFTDIDKQQREENGETSEKEHEI
jgi:hypothetical protein